MTQDQPVQGLTPHLYPAQFIDGAGSSGIQCGLCGCNKTVEFYVYTTGPQCFDPVCDCPLPAVLTA